jgi:hypothetical protein
MVGDAGMARGSNSAFFEAIDLEGDFPDIDDVEGYVEQTGYYDRSRVERTYFYRVGNSLSITFVPCADVDCEGVYYVKDIIKLAYAKKKRHLEGTLSCCVCRDHDRKGSWCKAKFSVDIRYKVPAQEPAEGPTVQSPEDRFDLF